MVDNKDVQVGIVVSNNTGDVYHCAKCKASYMFALQFTKSNGIISCVTMDAPVCPVCQSPVTKEESFTKAWATMLGCYPIEKTYRIWDIDGSLCESIFKNDNSQDQSSLEFQQQLSALPLFNWVLDDFGLVLKGAQRIIFITGRGKHLNEITRSWVSCNLQISKFEIVNVGFIDYEQYVSDKKLKLLDALDKCNETRESERDTIHLLEDDPRIISWDVKIAQEYQGVMVHQVEKGKHFIVYPFEHMALSQK